MEKNTSFSIQTQLVGCPISFMDAGWTSLTAVVEFHLSRWASNLLAIFPSKKIFDPPETCFNRFDA